MKRVITMMVAIVMALGVAVQSEADLQTIGTATYMGGDYNLIYDNDDDLVWLDYTVATTLPWASLDSWASGLGGSLTYNLNAGHSMTWSETDWRLPATVDGPRVYGYDGTTTAGYNITSSELGHLYYSELGNLGYVSTDNDWPQPGYGLENTGDFSNLKSGGYWSGTEYSSDTSKAWFFDTSSGVQDSATKTLSKRGMAVRSGQLAVVPEPVSVILFLIGGATLGFRRLGMKSIK